MRNLSILLAIPLVLGACGSEDLADVDAFRPLQQFLGFGAGGVMRPVFEAARHPAFGPSYAFGYSSDRSGVPQEGASVRFAWDETGLFVRAAMEDSRCIAHNREDEQLHYMSGDVFELFVKPLHAPYKWEMYATPFGNKSTLFFPSWPTDLTPEQGLRNHNYRGLEIRVDRHSSGWNALLVADLVWVDAGAVVCVIA